MDTDYSITHICGVLVTDGDTAFTSDADCDRTNPHYYEASRWMRCVLFFSEIALRNVIICPAVKSFLRFASFIQTIPLPHEASLTYQKKHWQTGLENWIMMLYICVDSCSESRFWKSNLWLWTGWAHLNLSRSSRSMMRCLENDSLHDEDVSSIHDDQNQTLPPERETGKKTKPSL